MRCAAGLAFQFIVGAAIAVGLACTGAPATRADTDPHVFNTVATEAKTNFAVNKLTQNWAEMQQRWNGGAPCPGARKPLCTSQGWQGFINGLKGKDPKAQLVAVNDHFNLSLYITDMANWQRSDFYATPYEFLKKSGDCEDYAIAKYWTLRALGFQPKDLRLLVVRIKPPDKRAHAILLAAQGGVTWVLDNYNTRLLEAKNVVHYEASFSMNELNWTVQMQR